MAHYIEILLGPVDSLMRLSPDASDVRVFIPRFGCRIGVLPLTLDTDEILPNWYGPVKNDRQLSILEVDDRIAKSASIGGALAYIRTDYHGDFGYQAAALWVDGARTYGIDTEWTDDPTQTNPMTQALGGLGIATGCKAEIDALGLWGMRTNSTFVTQWLEWRPGMIPDPPAGDLDLVPPPSGIVEKIRKWLAER